MLNLGYIEATCADGDVTVRIYYDATAEPVGDSQPLINGPRGYCLDMTNRTGRLAKVTVDGLAGQPLEIKIQKGDPVIIGPPAGRSRTAAQMAQLGLTTRGSVGNLQIDCGN